MRKAGISPSEMARRIGCTPSALTAHASASEAQETIARSASATAHLRDTQESGLTAHALVSTTQAMENILITRGGRAVAYVLALIARLGGRTVALPAATHILVLVDEGHTGAGEVRYVGADRTIAVHYGNDPLHVVHQYPLDRIRAVFGAYLLAGLVAHLATDPAIACDLDASDADAEIAA